MKQDINQWISKGVEKMVDNIALQAVLKVIEENKPGVEDMLYIRLGVCTFCNKQFIGIEIDGKQKFNGETCINCENPIDEKLIVYTYAEDTEVKQIICLESEAEEVTKKYQASKNQ